MSYEIFYSSVGVSRWTRFWILMSKVAWATLSWPLSCARPRKYNNCCSSFTSNMSISLIVGCLVVLSQNYLFRPLFLLTNLSHDKFTICVNGVDGRRLVGIFYKYFKFNVIACKELEFCSYIWCTEISKVSTTSIRSYPSSI